MKFRKKPIIIDAYQWFEVSKYIEGEKRDVDYYRTPKLDGSELCSICHKPLDAHGWLETLEGGMRVCPGDWIITGIQGEHYPCKPDIFKSTYDREVE